MKKLYLISFACLFAIISCNDLNIHESGQGRVVFSSGSAKSTAGSVEMSQSMTKNTEKSASVEDVTGVLISIENADTNETVYSNYCLSISQFGGGFISESLELDVGAYDLTGFLLINDENDVLYAAPIEGSEKAYLVSDPLPIHFTIENNTTKTIIPQVIAVDPTDDPGDFGYVNFGFEVVDPSGVVTLSFTGRVTEIEDDEEVIGNDITVGDPVSGYLTYNKNSEDCNPEDEIIGFYDYFYHQSPSPYGITVNINDYQFKTDPEHVDFGIMLRNNVDYGHGEQDQYLLLCSYNKFTGPNLEPEEYYVSGNQIDWHLFDGSATALTSDELTGDAPVLADWSSQYMYIRKINGLNSPFKIIVNLESIENNTGY